MTTYSVNPTLTSTSGNTTTQNVATGDTINVTVAPGSSNATVVNANATNCSVSPSQDTSSPFTFTINTFTSTSYSAYFYFVDGNTVTWDVTVSGTVSSSSPTYSVTAPASINEGSSGTMNVSTTNVGNGTTLYWTVEPAGDFGTTSGSFSISSNAGSFTVTPSADQTTEGAETGTIRIRTGSTSGTIVASDTFTINDTSTTPAGPGLGATISTYTGNPTRYNNDGSTYTTATTTVVATSAYTHGLGNCASNTRYWASYTSGASGDTATYSTISPIGRTYTTTTSRTLAGMGSSSASIALPSSYGGARVYIWADLAGTTVTSSTTMTCTGASYYIEYPDDAITLTPSTTSLSSGDTTTNPTVNVTGDTSGTQYRLYTLNIPRWISTYNGAGPAPDFTIAYSESELPAPGGTYTYFSQCRVTAGVNDGANSGGGALWINTGNSFTITRSSATDTGPDSFSFQQVSGVATGSGQHQMGQITVSGITNTLQRLASLDTPTGDSPSNQQFKVNNGSWASTSRQVTNQDTVYLRGDAPGNPGTTNTYTLRIDGGQASDVTGSGTITTTSSTGGGSGGTSGGSGTATQYGLLVKNSQSTTVLDGATRLGQTVASGIIDVPGQGASSQVSATGVGQTAQFLISSFGYFINAQGQAMDGFGSIVYSINRQTNSFYFTNPSYQTVRVNYFVFRY